MATVTIRNRSKYSIEIEELGVRLAGGRVGTFNLTTSALDACEELQTLISRGILRVTVGGEVVSSGEDAASEALRAVVTAETSALEEGGTFTAPVTINTPPCQPGEWGYPSLV